jgi:hypothetical protein
MRGLPDPASPAQAFAAVDMPSTERTFVMSMRSIAAIGAASLLVLLAAFAARAIGAGPEVPDSLRVPETQTLSLAAHAVGVQIYDCKPSRDDPARFEWAFRAPEADLFDAAGNRIGKHYDGPTWESNDGSRVVGEIKARDVGPDPTAIPWLLLTAKSTSGQGILAHTLSVQRIETIGGKPPPGGCGPAQAARAREARVPYRAVYNFFGAAH